MSQNDEGACTAAIVSYTTENILMLLVFLSLQQNFELRFALHVLKRTLGAATNSI